MLDMVAAALASGSSTSEIGKQTAEFNVCQVYIAVAIEKFVGADAVQVLPLLPLLPFATVHALAVAACNARPLSKVAPQATLDTIIADLHACTPLPGEKVAYPGEGMFKTRCQNLADGCPVDAEQWEALQAL
eukprot:SAG11_NODE_2373_length_3445_cov_11.317693_2_plen_132_part_00